jgi:hypothetical protein
MLKLMLELLIPFWLHMRYISCLLVPYAHSNLMHLCAVQQSAVTKGSLKETFLLAIPSFFDLVATVLMNVGLLSVTASVYQMMRGAEMLFAALFALLFLKRHLNKYHGMGILCCVVSNSKQAASGYVRSLTEVLSMIYGLGFRFCGRSALSFDQCSPGLSVVCGLTQAATA